MPMTAVTRKALGDAAIGKATFTAPTNVSMALFTASPGDGGSFAAEVTGGSYARVEITSKMGAFDATTGIAESTAIIEFATPTANWGTITHVGVVNNTTTQLSYYEALPAPRVVLNGGRKVRFTIGQFRIKMI